VADPAEVVAAYRAAGLTIAVAESLTAGLVTARLADVPGASTVLRGGVVAYASDLKASLLGVDPALLAEHGPVAAEVAVQMACGARERLGADVAVATTGVAGPDPQGDQPPGTVFVATATDDTTRYRGIHLFGPREQVRRETVDLALGLLLQALPQRL
jgi:nicotinamide-nucleotide amidase